MKYLVLFCILSFTEAIFAADWPICQEKELSLIGFYGDKGEHLSPVLDSWSEESGNLRALKIKSKKSYIKVVYNFFDNNKNLIGSIEIKLVNNRSSIFDLNQVVSKLKKRPKYASIRVFDKFNALYCAFEQQIIEVDGQDGVLKNVK